MQIFFDFVFVAFMMYFLFSWVWHQIEFPSKTSPTVLSFLFSFHRTIKMHLSWLWLWYTSQLLINNMSKMKDWHTWYLNVFLKVKHNFLCVFVLFYWVSCKYTQLKINQYFYLLLLLLGCRAIFVLVNFRSNFFSLHSFLCFGILSLTFDRINKTK